MRPTWAKMGVGGEDEGRTAVSNGHYGTTTVAAKHDLAATADERREIGRQARILAPRADLGDWDERARGHDPVDTLLAQNHIRLPELAGLRHQRMTISPWNFYRGAAAIMAADLASRPHSRIEVQLCGDAHVLNFGMWATPERNLNFDLRDFDETLPGPFEWDVARLAASLVVAARENGVKPSQGGCRGDGLRRRLPEPHAVLLHPAAARHLVREHALRPVHRLLRAGRPRPGQGAVREEEGRRGPAAAPSRS